MRLVIAITGFCLLLVLAWGLPLPDTWSATARADLPLWLALPTYKHELLALPALVCGLTCWLITRTGEPRRWSRFAVVAISLILLLRYLLWRVGGSLNLSDSLTTSVSLLLLAAELLSLLATVIQLLLLVRTPDTRLQPPITEPYDCPSVDILIPTYNEPAFIVERTIIGAQAIDYPHKRIYLLDDTRRPDMRALAATLGCEYLARADNRHAKAGNLNHALACTAGDLVAVFDADFVPVKTFLARTVGWFNNPNVGLVQTPQSFYNPDPIARNLGLDRQLTPEEEVFYRQIQPMRDGVGSVVCAGTSFVVRRSTLKAVGGFVTRSLSEDYFTGVKIAAAGYKVIYLREKLSAGLAAENMATHARQRIRWAQGTIQGLFIPENPLAIPGLSFWQRLGHLEGLLHWFTSLARIVFLIMPLIYSFGLIVPLRATSAELVYYLLPYYAVQLISFGWLNYRSRSALLSDIYGLSLVFPLAFTVVQTLVRPFGQGFSVTPKGTLTHRFRLNRHLAWPLLALFTATSMAMARNLHLSLAFAETKALAVISLGWVWSAYNLAMILIATWVWVDAPRTSPYDWFARHHVTNWGDRWGMTQAISETGAILELAAPPHELSGQFQVSELNLSLPARVSQIEPQGQWYRVELTYESLNLSQRRHLIEALYCQPGTWPTTRSPGEWQSLAILWRSLWQPLWLRKRLSRPYQPVQTYSQEYSPLS